MVDDTNSILYKLLNKTLKNHSEQLLKVLAGLFDSDGCVGIRFNSCGCSSYNNEESFLIQLVSQFDQSASNDEDLQALRAVHNYLGFGTITFRARDNWAHQAALIFSGKNSETLFNLIGKHLYVKAKHFENMLWIYKELKGLKLTRAQIDELKEFSMCSRDSSGPLKPKKHISPAYLAGLIAGDGWVTVRLNVPRLRQGWLSHENQMSVAITLHKLDSDVLYKIQSDYGGKVTSKDKDMVVWKRNLGKESRAFALEFTKSISEFMLLEKKYKALKKIQDFHKLPAETKCLGHLKTSVSDSPRR